MKLCKSYLFFVCAAFFVASVNAANTAQDIIKNSVKMKGFFDIYKHQSGDLYLSIDQFDQEFIYQTSVVSGLGSNDVGIDRGRLADTRLVVFEKRGAKVFLKQINLKFRADTDDPLEAKTIQEAFADSIIWSGELIKQGKKSYLVKLNSLVIDDKQNIIADLARRKQGAFKLNSGFSSIDLSETKSFPKNTEMTAILTFQSNNPGEYVRQVAAEPSSISLVTRHSFVALPEPGYQPRAFHAYSGYWGLGYENYAAAVTESMQERYIPRHRLQKKYPEKSVSPAVEPIIYYLDAGTPEPVRSALLDGAKWWNQAFEAAGYQDAFQVKMLPADADPMDVRYNTIQWIHRATRGWSYGGAVVDPRNGEIIKGHVSLGSLRVRQDLLIALGLQPTDSTNGSKQNQLDMALARIRQLSAHEIGHTLGIAHNFSASTNERASVMDYPHPLITVEQGRILLDQAYATGIGQWDIHAVKYGYSDFSEQDESKALASIIESARGQGLRYMSDPDARSKGSANPYASLWDNGSNVVDELKRLVNVRSIALANFNQSVLSTEANRSDFQEALVPIFYLHRYQLQAAAKVIGGFDYQYGKNGEQLISQVASDDWQRSALQEITKTLKPEFLNLDENLNGLLYPKSYGSFRNRESFPSANGVTSDYAAIAEASMHHGLEWLLNSQRLNRVHDFNVRGLSQMSVAAIVDKLIDISWNAKKQKSTSATIHQRLNFVVADHLFDLIRSERVNPEVKALILHKLKNWSKKLKKKKSTKAYLGHFESLSEGLDAGIKSNAFSFIKQRHKLPPGSPI
jgi:hypothetical protein